MIKQYKDPILLQRTWNAIVIAGKLLEAEQYADSLALLEEIGAFPSLAEKSRALVALFSGECLYHTARDKAAKQYKLALKLSPECEDACTGLGNVYRDGGELLESSAYFRKAMELPTGSHTSCFNYAQSLEYVGDYDGAIHLVQETLGRPVTTQLTYKSQVHLHAMLLLLVKLLFACPRGPALAAQIPGLIAQIYALPENILSSLRGLHTHWAYMYFIKHMIQTSGRLPMLPTEKRVHCVGDSHVLSLAWQQFEARGEKYTFTPHLVTGLQAWHLKPDNPFRQTRANTELVLKALKGKGVRRVLFSAGEIDCRDSLAKAVAKGYHASIRAAVNATADVLVNALKKYSEEYAMTIYLMTVPPPSNSAQRQRSDTVRIFNQALGDRLGGAGPGGGKGVVLVDCYQKLCAGDGTGSLKPKFRVDGTHCNWLLADVLVEQLSTLQELC